ncbi:MAG: hypothetical protein RLY31_1109 [Bacteroidota bacterium]|jgi:enamine deaminase RidA (YjgF/YER057c/UK114 family)
MLSLGYAGGRCRFACVSARLGVCQPENEVMMTRTICLFLLCGLSPIFLTGCAEKQAAVGDPLRRLAELGLSLPAVSAPVANYVNTVRTGNLVFVAGKGPALPDGGYVSGRLGLDLQVTDGYAAARLAGLHALAALQAELGDLRKVVRVVRVLGMVQATDDFTQHPEVVNGCSDLLVEVFGDRGRHARAAVGMSSLPRNMCVEVELVVEVAP